MFDRCIMGFNAGPPMTSGTYNNNVMIFQAPGYVAILNEMVHNARNHPDRRRREAAVPAAQRRLPRPLGRRDPRHRDHPGSPAAAAA